MEYRQDTRIPTQWREGGRIPRENFLYRAHGEGVEGEREDTYTVEKENNKTVDSERKDVNTVEEHSASSILVPSR